MPDIVLGSEDKVFNRTEEMPPLWKVVFYWKTQVMSKKKKPIKETNNIRSSQNM